MGPVLGLIASLTNKPPAPGKPVVPGWLTNLAAGFVVSRGSSVEQTLQLD